MNRLTAGSSKRQPFKTDQYSKQSFQEVEDTEFSSASSVSSDTTALRSDLLTLGIDLDDHLIERMQVYGMKNLFQVANETAEILRSRKKSTPGESPTISLRKVSSPEKESISTTILDPFRPEILQEYNQRMSSLLRDWNDVESAIDPPTRVSVQRMIQNFQHNFSRHPLRFISQLLNEPISKKIAESIFGNSFDSYRRSSSKNLHGCGTSNNEEQMEEINRLILKNRFLGQSEFQLAILRVDPTASPAQVKVLFDALSNTKIFCGHDHPPVNEKVVDLSMFLLLLKQASRESRRSYDCKTSRIAGDVEFWNRAKVHDSETAARSLVVGIGGSSGGGGGGGGGSKCSVRSTNIGFRKKSLKKSHEDPNGNVVDNLKYSAEVRIEHTKGKEAEWIQDNKRFWKEANCTSTTNPSDAPPPPASASSSRSSTNYQLGRSDYHAPTGSSSTSSSSSSSLSPPPPPLTDTSSSSSSNDHHPRPPPLPYEIHQGNHQQPQREFPSSISVHSIIQSHSNNQVQYPPPPPPSPPPLLLVSAEQPTTLAPNPSQRSLSVDRRRKKPNGRHQNPLLVDAEPMAWENLPPSNDNQSPEGGRPTGDGRRVMGYFGLQERNHGALPVSDLLIFQHDIKPNSKDSSKLLQDMNPFQREGIEYIPLPKKNNNPESLFEVPKPIISSSPPRWAQVPVTRHSSSHFMNREAYLKHSDQSVATLIRQEKHDPLNKRKMKQEGEEGEEEEKGGGGARRRSHTPGLSSRNTLYREFRDKTPVPNLLGRAVAAADDPSHMPQKRSNALNHLFINELTNSATTVPEALGYNNLLHHSAAFNLNENGSNTNSRGAGSSCHTLQREFYSTQNKYSVDEALNYQKPAKLRAQSASASASASAPRHTFPETKTSVNVNSSSSQPLGEFLLRAKEN